MRPQHTIANRIQDTIWRAGIKVSRSHSFNNAVARRKALFDTYGIDLVLDVGANVGQYADELRRYTGYRGAIVSFEPLADAFAELDDRATNDPDWFAVNKGLGATTGTIDIGVSLNSVSSSILPMASRHAEAAPESKYVSHQSVAIARLDDVIGSLPVSGSSIYLKIDVQGYEVPVLDGAEASLAQIDTIQIELSLTELYRGQALAPDIWERLSGLGYTLVGIEPGFADPVTGELLQFDGIFHRMDSTQ